MSTATHTAIIQDDQKIFIDDYLLGKLDLLDTRKSIKKALRRGEVCVNGDVVNRNYMVKSGDIIRINRKIKRYEDQPSPEIIFMDTHLCVVHKPPGILSSGNGKITMQKMLSSIETSDLDDALPYPTLIHRLDRDTTGLLIAARSKTALTALNAMIGNREIDKYYIALVEQHDVPVKTLNSPIDGKPSITHIIFSENQSTRDPSSLVLVKLETGRTHQIRKHLKSIGHPIIGDMLYNPHGSSFSSGLFLQSIAVIFDHPCTGKPLISKDKLHKKFKKYDSNTLRQAIKDL